MLESGRRGVKSNPNDQNAKYSKNHYKRFGSGLKNLQTKRKKETKEMVFLADTQNQEFLLVFYFLFVGPLLKINYDYGYLHPHATGWGQLYRLQCQSVGHHYLYDLWPSRHLMKVMRIHDLINKKTLKRTKTKKFWAFLVTCDHCWDTILKIENNNQ